MSRSAKIDMFDLIARRPDSAWSYEPDPAEDAEMEAMFADVVRRQKEASARYSALAAGTPPLSNVRPAMPTPTASSPAALPVERAAEYLNSGPKKTAKALKSLDPVSPQGSPTEQVLFKNRKTGRVWKIGQDVDCLSTELEITRGEAEALLRDGNGKDAPTILSLLKKSWKGLKGASNRAAYMRGIVRNQSTAKPTEQTPPPVPPGPLPLQPAAASSKPVSVIETNDNNRARRDRILTKAFSEMGRGEVAEDKYTMMDFSRHFDVGVEGLRKVRAHLNDMRLRGLVRFVGDGVYAAVPEWQR